jgi:hypothetical protein
MRHGRVADPTDGGRCPLLGRFAKPHLADRLEVERLATRPAEQAQVPHVLAALGLGIGIGQADHVDAEAGEPNMGPVADALEQAQVELGERSEPQRPEVVDPRAHPAGDDGDLLCGSAADGVGELEADQLRKPPQRQHPAVDRLAHAGRPFGEGRTAGPAVGPPDLRVGQAQSRRRVGGRPIAGRGGAVAEVGEGLRPGQELLEGVALASPLPPLEDVARTQAPAALCRSRTAPPVAGGHHTGMVGPAAPDEHLGLAAGQPRLEVARAGRLELGPVADAERMAPVPVAGAAGDGTAPDPVESAARHRKDQLGFAVPLPGQPIPSHQRRQALDAPVHRLLPGCPNGSDGR